MKWEDTVSWANWALLNLAFKLFQSVIMVISNITDTQVINASR